MRIATWNVNSLRSRIDRVEAFLERHDVDVLAVQETKGREDQLPLMGLQALGYDAAVVGHDQWNGVGLFSRVGLEDVAVGYPGMPTWGEPPREEARALGATCAGVRVWSLYVPNGRKPGDPHYVYKLDWLKRLRGAAAQWTADPVALVGDWNVCPTDADVFDPKRFRNSTHVTPPEREAFAAFTQVGYREVTRGYDSGYTYWDYYRQRFQRDRGLKIDFVYATEPLAGRVTDAWVDREERAGTDGAGTGTSDHAPVVVDVER